MLISGCLRVRAPAERVATFLHAVAAGYAGRDARASSPGVAPVATLRPREGGRPPDGGRSAAGPPHRGPPDAEGAELHLDRVPAWFLGLFAAGLTTDEGAPWATLDGAWWPWPTERFPPSVVSLAFPVSLPSEILAWPALLVTVRLGATPPADVLALAMGELRLWAELAAWAAPDPFECSAPRTYVEARTLHLAFDAWDGDRRAFLLLVPLVSAWSESLDVRGLEVE